MFERLMVQFRIVWGLYGNGNDKEVKILINSLRMWADVVQCQYQDG